MKILQITSSNSDTYPVFGLGDDNRIYKWSYWSGTWILVREVKNENQKSEHN